MVNGNKVIMTMFSIMLVMCFCVGCSSSNIPSEDEMKGIIMTIEMGHVLNDKRFKLEFDSFKITNGFVSKNKGGGGESSPYCIEVNYKLKNIFTDTDNIPKTQEIVEDNKRYSFVKKGDKWYGSKGWR